MFCVCRFLGASLCFALLAFFACCAARCEGDDAGQTGPAKISFAREVAPIFLKHCLACHGPKKPEGEFQLHTYSRLMTAGASGEPAIIAGKANESYLVELLTSGDADLRMPKEQKPLDAGQIDLIRRWIAEGALFDGDDASAPLESFIPKTPHPLPPKTYPRPAPVTALAFSPDGAALATSGYHEVLVWEVRPRATGSASAGKQEAPGSAGGSNGGSLTREAIPGQNPELSDAGRVATPTLARRIQNIAQRTHAIAFNADGSLVAIAAGTPGRCGEVVLFNAQTGQRIADLCTTSDEVFDVEFSRDGTRLAACGADRTIRIFNVAEQREERRIEAHADWAMAVAWSPDGTKLASAGRDKTAKLIDAATGAVLVTYPGHDEQVYDALFSLDGNQVFSAGAGRELHRWGVDGKSTSKSDVRKKETGAIIGRTGGQIYKLAVQAKQVLAVSDDGKLTAFDPDNDKRQLAMLYEGAPRQAFALAIHEPTGQIAVGGFDGRVMLYEVGDAAPWSVLIASPGFGNR